MVTTSVVGGCSSARGHGAPTVTTAKLSDLIKALKQTEARGSIRFTKTCSAPAGVSTPSTIANRAVDCGSGSGVVNEQTQSEEFVGPYPGATGGMVRDIRIASEQWSCASLDPTSSPTCFSGQIGGFDDPLQEVSVLVTLHPKLSVLSEGIVNQVPVQVVEGSVPAGVKMTVAIGTDGLIHQVGDATTADAVSGKPTVFSTWTMTDFGVATPITAPPASEVRPGPP